MEAELLAWMMLFRWLRKHPDIEVSNMHASVLVRRVFLPAAIVTLSKDKEDARLNLARAYPSSFSGDVQ